MSHVIWRRLSRSSGVAAALALVLAGLGNANAVPIDLLDNTVDAAAKLDSGSEMEEGESRAVVFTHRRGRLYARFGDARSGRQEKRQGKYYAFSLVNDGFELAANTTYAFALLGYNGHDEFRWLDLDRGGTTGAGTTAPATMRSACRAEALEAKVEIAPMSQLIAPQGARQKARLHAGPFFSWDGVTDVRAQSRSTTLQSVMELTPSRARSGRLFVISAPSGAGKTSLVQALMQREPGLRFSISYTTRPRRAAELDGRDYHFVTTEEFEAMVAGGEFLEHARVFDNRYGTARRQVKAALAAGQDLILEIDWQGAQQIRTALPQCVSIFILPPSRAELERRLRGRGTDAEHVIERRLQDAANDMSHWSEFDFVVVNDDFAQALEDICQIVDGRGEPCSSSVPGLAALVRQLTDDHAPGFQG